MIREEGAIVSMTPLGSSPGGEVFYVSSEESGSRNVRFGPAWPVLAVDQGWQPRWPADSKLLNWFLGSDGRKYEMIKIWVCF